MRSAPRNRSGCSHRPCRPPPSSLRRNISLSCPHPGPPHFPSVPLTQKLAQLVEDLAVLDDPQERLALVVDRARRIPPLDPAERTDANRVHGCVSVVWLVASLRDGKCVFRGDAEPPLVRGLVVLLCEFFSGFPPAALASTTADP